MRSTIDKPEADKADMHDTDIWPAAGGRGRPRGPLPLLDDDTLLRRARDGDQRAFGELYQRHARAAHAYARRLSLRHLHHDAADDIVAEAVRKILDAIAHGVGPVHEFRRYFFTSVRSITYTQSRLGRPLPLDDTADAAIDPIDDWLNAVVATDAFNDLPRRWRDVLWATTVLGYSPTELAPTAGLSTNNVAVLSRRARDGLRLAYARRYLPRAADRRCGSVLDALARSVLGGRAHTGSRAGLIRHHLDRCAHCRTAAADLHESFAAPSRLHDAAEAAAG